MIKLKPNPYFYQRSLPHYQKQGCTLFVTFCKLLPDPFPDTARSRVLQHCLHDNDKKLNMHAAIVMPEHVHLLLTPFQDGVSRPYPLQQILKLIKGTSARSVNLLTVHSGPVWQEESFDHVLRVG
jgi:REP element-mobilizing transposase RayT